MIDLSRRTFANAAILLGAGLFALGGASRIPPLAWIDRQALGALAGMLDPAQLRIDGPGSHDEPWMRRVAIPPTTTAPRFLGIDDDPDQWFSSSPLSPVDHALIFARLREAGHRVIGVGHLMAWDEPEPLAIAALRKQLDRLDAAVLALPLARGAGAEPLPAPFLRMSLAESAVDGDVSALPRVNRLAVADAELGGERGLAGFSLLENESDPGDGRQPLLARWNDRILFAFPLAVEIAALGLDPAEVTIEPGKRIRLGGGGPVFPIDEFGRTPVAPGAAAIDIPAARLISEEHPIPVAGGVLLTRDCRSGLAAADKAWSDGLAGIVHTLRAAPRFGQPVELRRPEPLVELSLVALLAFLATWASRLRPRLGRIAASLLVTGSGALLLHHFATRQNAWLPPLAMLCPGLIALGLSFRRGETAPPPAPAKLAADSAEPATEARAQPEAQAPTPPEQPAGKTTEKAPGTPPKKAAKKSAKKAAPKKTTPKNTAKKAVRKSAPKKDDPAD